jgi:hypothetical protein
LQDDAFDKINESKVLQNLVMEYQWGITNIINRVYRLFLPAVKEKKNTGGSNN